MTTPFPDEWTVRRALEAYLEENGFTVAAYDAKWTDASFFGIPFKVPNTARHRSAIMLHDLHHVATGFGTDLVGEGEISAWELRGGMQRLGLYVGAIVLAGALAGAMLAPRRAWQAWRRADGARSLFELVSVHDDAAYTELLELRVADLRARIGIPASGIATAPRRHHHFAPRAL